MVSISEKLIKEVMNGADFMGDMEKDVPYTTDELEQICVWAELSGKGSKVSGRLSRGKEVGHV